MLKRAVLAVSTLLLACESPAAKPPTNEQAVATASAVAPTAERAAGLVRVSDPGEVCMVNDQYMGRAQIPVVVEGRTYFGCCPMCQQKLEQSQAVRTAIDPFSGRTVDKAKAIIAKTASGNVLYFERAENLERYASR